MKTKRMFIASAAALALAGAGCVLYSCDSPTDAAGQAAGAKGRRKVRRRRHKQLL